MRYLVLTVLTVCAICVLAGEDYYKLLGLERDADNREIRKAFKKLALKMHPDKNSEDPDAHDNFVKLTRAYEVLKDEDLRKKYDEFGEKGLSDDFRNPRYESWKFYQQNFGIYDDDEEIITLSTTDFEQSVESGGDIWFINYYSAHCSHCHELAPTWREVARQLEGVIRIGAVNCEDAWILCRQQGIRSYPSLLIYDGDNPGVKYQGSRDVESLIKRALSELTVLTYALTSDNIEGITSNSNRWLITYCTDVGGDCLDKTELLKIATILKDLVSVGSVDCIYEMSLCERLGIEQSQTLLYTGLPVSHTNKIEITELGCRFIASAVLHHLPEVNTIDDKQFREVLDKLLKSETEPWLIHFTHSQSENIQIELRRLPALLINEISVGRLDCNVNKKVCSDYHIHKYPTFIVFKPGGGYEIHHGRSGAQDVAAFARDCGYTTVRVLNDEDVHDIRVNADLWFIDFFAPWCPPCMRLLPEFRKASRHYNEISHSVKVRFGTVDCTIHSTLCEQLHIRSYPTTILYNNTVPHKFRGGHDAASIIEFIEDTLNPPVILLTDKHFNQKILAKSTREIWIVDYYTPWCGPCMGMMSDYRRFAKTLKGKENIFVASIDCQAYPQTCNQVYLKHYPTIRLYHTGHVGAEHYSEYSGYYRNTEGFLSWAQDYLPSKVVTLNSQNFEHTVLESKAAWVIDYYANWCGPCQKFSSQYERVAEALEGKIKVGKIDCAKHRHVCQQAYIQSYPSLRYYPGARSSVRQGWFGETVSYTGQASPTLNDLEMKLVRRTKIYKDEL